MCEVPWFWYIPDSPNFFCCLVKPIIVNNITSCRWRIFRRPIIVQRDRVILYAKATRALHNYFCTTESSVYCSPGYIDKEDSSGNFIAGGWKADEDQCTGMLAVACTSSNRYICNYIYLKFSLLLHNISPIHVIYNVCRNSTSEASIRKDFMNYFCSSTDEVLCQYDHVCRTQ